MKRMLFVYNPNSGMGLLKPKLSDVIDTFVKGGYEVTVYPTQRSQDAVRKVSEYTEEYDLVTCSGGDGTLDEVVTGMMMRENKTPIGYLFCYEKENAFFQEYAGGRRYNCNRNTIFL